MKTLPLRYFIGQNMSSCMVAQHNYIIKRDTLLIDCIAKNMCINIEH